jgi:four helix bundle protein
MTTDELKQRTQSFALRVTRLVNALPNAVNGPAIANQITRSATSVAANHRSAYRARSRAEFIAKIGVVEEEADERAFWLELIVDTNVCAQSQIEPLLKEAGELVAIMAASRKSPIGTRKSSMP